MREQPLIAGSFVSIRDTLRLRLLSRLSGLTQNLNGTSNDTTFGYGYNPAGEIASSTRSNDAYGFTLANANVTSTANGLNQLTAQGGANVTYDARGNVDVIGSVAYGYLAENRMWVTTAISGGYLYYDPADPAYIVVRQNSGHELVQERAYNGAIRRRYVHGAGTDEPLVWYEGTGLTDRRWLHADERGSIVAASDGSGNLVGSINRYDDYGAPQGGSLTGRFGYTGQAWIPEIGMYDYRARFYNPAMGRFMQSDPIGFGGGMNVYAYVGNNPVNFTDPTGLQCDGCEIPVTGNRDPRCDDEGTWWDADPRQQIFCNNQGGWSPSGFDPGAGSASDSGPGLFGILGVCTLPSRVNVAFFGNHTFLYGALTYVAAHPYTWSPGTRPTPSGGTVSDVAQDFFTGSINSGWIHQTGQSSITSLMWSGPGGTTVYVSPPGRNGWGGPSEWIQFSDNRVTPAYAAVLAAHEFGHALGLRHDRPGVGLMSPLAWPARPTEQNIQDIREQCRG